MVKDSTEQEIKKLLAILPPKITKAITAKGNILKLVEVVLDLGSRPEARYEDKAIELSSTPVAQSDINYVTSKIGVFTADNRAGIERTLHRISAIRNRSGKIVGLTCRVGRAVFGTLDAILDIIETGQNILFLGPPGIGKTTKLREAARILSDKAKKRVIVVDTSNEIAGDGDIPHTGIGRSRRMQVSTPERQHAVMIEAVENHMPEVIIVDEIGTEAEALAARTIAERGVQLIGTAHGTALENILSNPTLSDLVGGIQTVILSDEEAKRRHTQKAILERKAPPTFDVAVEIRARNTLAIYSDVASAIDKMLKKQQPKPEIRVVKASGEVEIKQKPSFDMSEVEMPSPMPAEFQKKPELIRIYPFAVNVSQLEAAITSLEVAAEVVSAISDADLVLTVKSKTKRKDKVVRMASEHNIPVHVIRKNVSSQIRRFLKYFFKVQEVSYVEEEEMAVAEVEEALVRLKGERRPIDLTPQNAYIRRLQHQYLRRHAIKSESIGQEPKRRVRLYPS
ncbi:MAG: AAA family ATPase [Candidatus Margulisbacteria bacterium]|nr:AAA family ATPase [Candidatus Margulisiibacteriota bacterium]MBU1021399.1 AAA family ATPase [Candidatus Margulisiibacteriota bacterium]MBU1729112.1 AAA family ATPase [Candidatus Margulisiibacteriota bacterium]MBU1954785.1 AAA family ATPase [Candidatus Margulisiibacteriota bacterium]